MALQTYRKKRDFRVTAEPRGGVAAAEGHLFVVQKHAARRLHYDFRLEVDGVLKSWAVTKGPSLVPAEKRLAVHVEDHPLEYGDFEGTIPQGQYGGGTVELWDRGTWTPLHDVAEGLAKGHLDFDLQGEKLHGRWHLVRMAARPREKRDNWLLIKGDDEAARTEADPDILEERPDSVKTGRSLDDITADRPPARRRTRTAAGTASPRPDPALAEGPGSLTRVKGAAAVPMPPFVAPALATLVPRAPGGRRWIHEIKLDGYRLLARIAERHVQLLTRSGLDWTTRFGPGVIDMLSALPLDDALIDGELVVENANGVSDFSALQEDLASDRTDRFVFYAFDLLHLDGYDLRGAPLMARKEILRRLVPAEDGPLRFSSHYDQAGDLVFHHACRLSLEGVVSKLRDAPYRSGRGRDWVKSKCSARQEFVIGGYVPSTVSKTAIGSLVLGVYDGGGLRHVGRVGTGFTAALARDLFRRLDPAAVAKSPFVGKLTADEARGVRYVRPELVAEIEFRAWTADGHLRHASFRGIREDKPATEIVREVETPDVEPPPPQRRIVNLTHPDRLYWPDSGVTKEGLADYYADVWRYIAPFIVDRPLALLRCPDGISGQTFFQKNLWKGASPGIVALDDPAAGDGGKLIGIHDFDGLMGLVQAATLEIHPWGASCRDWERPDMIVMDLDPGEDVPWTALIDAAQEVRRRLEATGLAAFVKTSGGKGLHVVTPLVPRADWATVKGFTRGLAQAMASDSPDRYVATITKARRRGRILVDYLRNQRGATAVAPYSTRARPGAPVSMPLAWDELGPGIGPAHFTLATAPARLAALDADPWEGFRQDARPLEAAPPDTD
ncbi:DNA ligase D [Gluconacetobacter tumulisoli]|uniref:DNA ligase (ATP) n=1 Tax=Gluconacetobacter tumulisoli TaxID=1286189 RepID=A0A7W4PM63_9PROT|nr:DNA ligase D [Gluconacetobacter tumulisoli]MBB2201324.1 DNA ligase D [Gluconacetobacter tumulisoli]